jgi:GT2 family glycosyltransferase
MALLSSLDVSLTSVLIVDDGSPCTTDPVLREAGARGARVVRHRRNRGIARSLNDGLAFAERSGATWLLTADQDSALGTDYLPRLIEAADQAAAALGPGMVGAVAAGGIDDASGALGYPVSVVSGVSTTHEVIQTGTLWSVDALVSLGGFDESLGIDAVDAAACLGLRAAGLHIVVAPGLDVQHRIGDARQVRILGREVLSSGHSPERHTTIVRNRLRLFPAEFAQSPVHAFRTVRRVAVNTALAVTIEDDRWAKAKASARGLLPRRKG